MRGRIFNIQRFCTDDGDGIRTMFFFKGCPLRCEWCHNPESQSAAAQLSYNAAKCIGCMQCAKSCPLGCHSFENGAHTVRRHTQCGLCRVCADACPTAALEITGELYGTDELVRIAERDREFYADNGGVTLSGGEPLMQGEFAAELAQALAERGISVDIETCGYCRSNIIEGIAPFCDTFLYDCKVMPQLHKELTGVDAELILRNLGIAASRGRVVLRCPIIGGVNDNFAHADWICSIAEKYRIIRAELLGYHKYGLSKSDFWGLGRQREFAEPGTEKLAEMAEYIQKHSGVPVSF